MKSSDFRREREQRRRAYYREGILHAAERAILRKGYSATTMDDVAREARLSKATIYKYIPGKGVLLYEILSHYFDELRNKTEAIASGAGTAADKLRLAIRLALAESESKQSLTRVLWMDKSMLKLMRVFVAASGKPAAATAADRKMIGLLRDKRREITAVGARILEEGVAAGEFRPMDTARAAEYLEAVLEGYTHARFWRGDAPVSKDAADDLTRFVLDGIRNPERIPKEN
jgi:AcrR family transcriptional regulator